MSDLTPGDPLRRKAVELEAGEVALHVGIVQDHNVRWAHLLGDSCIIAGEPLLTEISYGSRGIDIRFHNLHDALNHFVLDFNHWIVR